MGLKRLAKKVTKRIEKTRKGIERFKKASAPAIKETRMAFTELGKLSDELFPAINEPKRKKGKRKGKGAFGDFPGFDTNF